MSFFSFHLRFNNKCRLPDVTRLHMGYSVIGRRMEFKRKGMKERGTECLF